MPPYEYQSFTWYWLLNLDYCTKTCGGSTPSLLLLFYEGKDIFSVKQTFSYIQVRTKETKTQACEHVHTFLEYAGII